MDKFQNTAYTSELKLFAMLLVILGHIKSPFSGVIFSFHMPLFFFISGYFIKFDNPKSEIAKNIKRLLVPYLIYSIFSILVGLIKIHINNSDPFSAMNIVKGFFFGMNLKYLNTYGFVLWYLPALFWARSMVILLRKLRFKFSFPIIILLYCFTVILLRRNIVLPFCMSQGILAVVWVYMGSYYNSSLRRIDFRIQILFLFCFVGLVFGFGYPQVNIADIKVSNLYYYLLYNFLLIMVLNGIFSSIFRKEFSLPRLIASNTMFFFVFHPYTNNIGAIVFKNNYILTFVSSVFLLAIGMIFYVRLKKRFKLLKYV